MKHKFIHSTNTFYYINNDTVEFTITYQNYKMTKDRLCKYSTECKVLFRIGFLIEIKLLLYFDLIFFYFLFNP